MGHRLINSNKRKKNTDDNRKGRLVDDDFIRHVENARKIYREATGGRKLKDSVEIIREMRDERDEHLYKVIWGDKE